MFKRKTLFTTLICSVALILLAIPCMISFNNAKHVDTPLLETRTTSVELSDQDIDYESVFNQFEDWKLETNETLTTFEGYQTLNLADLMEIDNVSVENLEESELKVKYNFSYDSETNIVTLSATTDYENGETEEDVIYGEAFVNEQGNLDAVLDIDGEYVLLSELQDAGLIQNCGWFKKIFKAVVQVVIVAAAASAVAVAFGAGLGAVIAVGAVAGAIGGGIAGAKISYDETGEVQIWAVAGGIIGGAVLGGLTGWGIGTIMGAGSKMTVGFGKGSFKSSKECLEFHFKKHGAEVGAKTVKEYSKLAAQTAKQVIDNNIVAKKLVQGATANVYRYEVGKFYIHMAKTAKEIIIVSFGLI